MTAVTDEPRVVPLRRAARTSRLWAGNPGARRAYLIVSAMTLAEGACLILFSPQRTSGPAYRTINEVGSADGVGAALLILVALLVLAPRHSPRALRGALLTGAALHFLVATSFLTSALADDRAGPLAPIYSGVIALWFISQAELYRLPRASPP